MLIGETYLKKYKAIIGRILKDVNIYFDNSDIPFDEKDRVKPSFFLRFLSNKNPYYNQLVIYQKNKQRILYEPCKTLKYIQKYILHMILNHNIKSYKLNDCVTGFLKEKSILHNAYPHLNRVAVIKMDIKEFFPTISRGMVYSIFKKYNNFSYEYAYILSHLVTYKNQLPQGAPTSPFLANICASGIDYKILSLIQKINITRKMDIRYTRYADDLTISFDKKFNYDYIINTVIDIILSEGFYPNFKKIKVIKKSQCQKVTGIVINNKEPSICKKEREKLKFILNIWEKYGIDDAVKVWNKNKLGTIIPDFTEAKNNQTGNKRHVKFKEILDGKINYFDMINSEQNQKLMSKFKELNNK